MNIYYNRRCLFTTYLWLHTLLRTSPQYGRAPVCTHRWNFRFSSLMKVLLHPSQGHQCSQVFTCWCTFWFSFITQSFITYITVIRNVPQYVHDVHSDVAVYWKFLLHMSQGYRRYPVCTRLCNFRLLLRLNVLLHESQQFGRSQVCICLCTFRCFSFWKFYYTYHSDMDTPQYAHADVTSN
jgi:hypothetical protein